jgi:hypothetical protein
VNRAENACSPSETAGKVQADRPSGMGVHKFVTIQIGGDPMGWLKRLLGGGPDWPKDWGKEWKDETLQLVKLCTAYRNLVVNGGSRQAKAQVAQQIRAIGEEMYKKGGRSLLETTEVRICRHFGAPVRPLEVWSGLGGAWSS